MSAIETLDAIRLSDVVSALSVALDLTEGQPMGHSIRSCILGMRIADELQISREDRSDLYYALLLKDSGCSSNSARMYQIMGADEIQAKNEVKFEDWTKVSLSGLRYLNRNVLPDAPLWRRAIRMVSIGLQQKRNNAALIGARCERGAEIARKIGLSENAAQAIRALDEHWDGNGYSEGRRGAEIPLLAQIINVSQTAEVYAFRHGEVAAIQVLSERSGTWFNPEIVRAVRSLGSDEPLWAQVKATNAREFVLQMEPGIAIPASTQRIDSLCEAFAQVIDAKSSYTFHHSVGVTEAAVEIAEGMELAPPVITMVRRAALLHDIGKLSVSNAILEKPGKLTEAEWKIMKMHPVYTRTILEKITGFEQLAFVAGAHHERLDGMGYPNGLIAGQMTLPARIVAVADVFQALSEKRPYRDGLPLEVVLGMMEKDVPHRLDPDCVSILKQKAKTASGGQFKTTSAGR
ncbi:MAG TPA: HD domain-containing phosphohydrolase [Terriglobales bacterium]|nr:HD domain-containing phosphohydrolase [Terriglobales bacterium]